MLRGSRMRFVGTCGGCGFVRRVNQNGRIKVHNHVTEQRRPDRCEGSGTVPRPCGGCDELECYLCTVG